MTHLLAIDPGNSESGVALIDTVDCHPLYVAKLRNQQLRDDLLNYRWRYDVAAVEMIASYGMPVGREVFDTCVWIGKFDECVIRATGECFSFVFRRDIKLHHCHSPKATDANIRQALVDRFAPGQPNHGKGTKAKPGWFHGFAADMWQAYALAVYEADKYEGRPS